jgi:hypothetical protein
MQFQAGDAPLPDQRRCSQRCQLAGVDWTGQQLGLQRQAALVGRHELVA